jgi:hypothetical protein
MGTGRLQQRNGLARAGVTARRTRCRAIGGLGAVTGEPATATPTAPPATTSTVALFFDSGTGIADAVRIDADDLAIGAHCDPGAVSDLRWHVHVRYDVPYGYDGGHVRFLDTVILAPPASFTHVARPRRRCPRTSRARRRSRLRRRRD